MLSLDCVCRLQRLWLDCARAILDLAAAALSFASPLSLTADATGDIATQMMTSILAADPSRDDGSLHNAARELNLETVKLLIKGLARPVSPPGRWEWSMARRDIDTCSSMKGMEASCKGAR